MLFLVILLKNILFRGTFMNIKTILEFCIHSKIFINP